MYVCMYSIHYPLIQGLASCSFATWRHTKALEGCNHNIKTPCKGPVNHTWPDLWVTSPCLHQCFSRHPCQHVCCVNKQHRLLVQERRNCLENRKTLSSVRKVQYNNSTTTIYSVPTQNYWKSLLQLTCETNLGLKSKLWRGKDGEWRSGGWGFWKSLQRAKVNVCVAGAGSKG